MQNGDKEQGTRSSSVTVPFQHARMNAELVRSGSSNVKAPGGYALQVSFGIRVSALSILSWPTITFWPATSACITLKEIMGTEHLMVLSCEYEATGLQQVNSLLGLTSM